MAITEKEETMGERRHDDTGSVATGEAPTVATLHARYAAEEALDRHDALRLVELRDKAIDVGLSAEEQVERIVLEQAREDREPRLQRLLREAVTAQDEVNLQEVVASWDALVAEKDAAYTQVQLAIAALYAAWHQVFHVHLQQEQAWAKLPRSGSSSSTFPGGSELAQWLTGRMPPRWNGVLNDPHQQVWHIAWAAVKDVDPGTKPLHETSIGRIRDRATAHRLQMTQQVENMPEDEEEC
jgi:hypothetical protein